jgi:hypothetical protein
MKRRLTYIARYNNGRSIRISAVDEGQAWHIAKGVGAKHKINVVSVGLFY